MALMEALWKPERYPVMARRATLSVREAEAKERAGRRVLDFLNGKYTLHVVDALRSGEKHFNELVREIPITTNTLRDRLRALQREGIVIRKSLNDLPPSVSYRLTDKGRELAGIIEDIKQWEVQWLGRHPDQGRAAVNMQAVETRKPYGKA